MTDKELKKLSRLELLELLLIESHENQKLRDELAKIEQENEVRKSVEQLNETNQQLQAALQQVKAITTAWGVPVVPSAEDPLPESAEDPLPEAAEESCPATEYNTDMGESEDATLYRCMMAFLAESPHTLFAFPDDLRERLTDRLNDILHARIAQHRAELEGDSLS